MSWQHERMAVCDTETSGVDVHIDRIVTACVGRVGGGEATEIRSWLLACPVEIPQAAIDVHGITNERAAAEGEDPAGAVDLIAGELCLAWVAGLPVVGHNVGFDLSIIAAELDRYALPSLEDRLGRPIGPVVDTFVLDKQVDRYRKGKRTLTRCCEVYDVALDGAHDATFDALASARIAWRICQRYPQIAGMSLGELHEAQVGWAAEQAAGLQDYFRRTDPTAVVDGTWPVRALPAAVAS